MRGKDKIILTSGNYMHNIQYIISILSSKTIRFLFYLLITITISACSFSLAQDIKPPQDFIATPVPVEPSVEVADILYPLVSPNPSNGKVVYEDNCASCHGYSGLGDGERAADFPISVPPISDPQFMRNAIPRDWYLLLEEGHLEKYMPPFSDLTDRQRWDVIAYVYQLATTTEKAVVAEENYKNYCIECHGDEGRGDGSRVDNLDISKMPDFHDQEFMSTISQSNIFQVISEGVSPYMSGFEDEMSEDDRWAMADYIRSLSFYLENEAGKVTPDPKSTSEDVPEAKVTQTVSLSDQEDKNIATISGEIENLSGGMLPVGEIITLHAFDHLQLVFTDTVTLDDMGGFVFQDIEITDGRAFLASVEYEGAIFGSDIVVANQDNLVEELLIEIYETTTDVSALTVDRLHYFFEIISAEDLEVLKVVELYVISNSSNKTLVSASEEKPAIIFSLPEGATALEFQDGAIGGRYTLTEDGFGDYLPVRPGAGQHQVMFSYQLPFDHKIDFIRPMVLNTDAIVILAPEGILVKGNGIEDAGTRDVQGLLYHMYNGEGLDRGEKISLEVSGRTSLKLPIVNSQFSNELLFGLGTLLIALIIVGVWFFNRRQPEKLRIIEDDDLLDQLNGESAESLMDAILTLDDLYKQGNLPKDAYIERRSELKNRLAEMLDDSNKPQEEG